MNSHTSIRFSVLLGFVLFLLLFRTVSVQAQQQQWAAVKTDIRFYIKNAGLEVEGSFDELAGTFVSVGPQRLPILVMGVAQVKSIRTGIGLRDSHLQAKAYFDAASFSEIRMQLVSIEGKNAKFSVTIKDTRDKAHFSAVFKLNRRDFKVGGGSMVLADEVLIRIKLDLRLLAASEVQ
jgi:polyisoprenoid-binding protein YceI